MALGHCTPGGVRSRPHEARSHLEKIQKQYVTFVVIGMILLAAFLDWQSYLIWTSPEPNWLFGLLILPFALIFTIGALRLAAIALLEDERPTLMVRLSGPALTTAIVREGVLCGYRCTDLPGDIETLSPVVLLEEVYPVAAYYQDTWHEGIQAVRLAGLGNRLEEFIPPMQKELQCPVSSLVHPVEMEGRIRQDARPLVDRGLDGLLGWMMNRGA